MSIETISYITFVFKVFTLGLYLAPAKYSRAVEIMEA